MSNLRRDLVLLLGGVNFMMLQFVTLRSFPTVMLELIIFLVILTYFMGCSAGYFLSKHVGPSGLRVFATLQWFTQLTIPFSIRWIAGTLACAYWNRTALVAVLFLGTFWTCSFYSILLPILISDHSVDGHSGFVRLYRLEMLGAILGLILVSIATLMDSRFLMVMYQGILFAIFCLIIWKIPAALISGAAWLGYAFAYPQLSQASIAYLYMNSSGLDIRRVLLEKDSQYQRIEVLEDDHSRYLFLDGFAHYAPHQDQFNYFIAGLPAALFRSPDVCVVGSGSLGAVRESLSGSNSVTSVEMDAAVAAAGRKWLAKPLSLDEERKWTLVIDDAKHFFANTNRRFDVVSLDIAGPFQRQVAMLYTTESLKILSSRLKSGGIVSAGLFGDFEIGSHTSLSIAQALEDVFNDVFIVVVADKVHPSIKSFAIAGNSTRITKSDIRDRLRQSGWPKAHIYDRLDIANLGRGRHAGISIKHLTLPLWFSYDRLLDGRFFFDIRRKL